MQSSKDKERGEELKREGRERERKTEEPHFQFHTMYVITSDDGPGKSSGQVNHTPRSKVSQYCKVGLHQTL